MPPNEVPVVLPFRGNQFSFSLSCKESPQEVPVADLSAVVFGRDGQVLDVVHPHKQSALMGAMCSGQDPSLWPDNCMSVPGDDVIHVFPKKMDPNAEVIAMVVSAPQYPGKVVDLGSAPKLDFEVTFTEPGDPGTVSHINRDLKGMVPKLAKSGNAGSMVVCVAYLDQPGWTVRFDMSGSPYPSWSLMVPEIKAAVLRVKTEAGVALDACQAISQQQLQDDTSILGFSRAYEDRSLDEAASVRLPEETQVKKLRLDVAWKFWNPKKEPEEELEGVNVEFAIKFFDTNGEEVLTAGTNEREADGVVVGRPEGSEEGEEEEEEEEKEKGEGEEEEEEDELDENGEPKLDENGEPIKKPKKEKPPPPPEPAEDPYEFKQRDVVFITLTELPKEVRSFIVLITNYEEAGFKPLKHAGIKLWDVSKGEEGARPLVDYGYMSKFEADEKITQAALLKVYKEYDDSAWNLWRVHARDKGVRTLEAFVHGDPEAIKAALKDAQAKHKEYKAKAAAAEEAEEEENEDEPKPELRTYTWRYSVPALLLGGQSLEDAEHDIKDNLLNYDGPLKADEKRTYDSARVQFSGEVQDTFFGAYENDLKSGPGIYCFATSAFYAGDFKAGKREGRGICLMPDGGLYEGELANDRFHGHGQYRYPNGSVYTGSWAGGKKDGHGVYWDIAKGCMRGNWSKGVLKGHAVYDQPAMHYEGEFVQGVPAGPCHFTIALHRTLDMPKFAASHILNSNPVLKGPAEYTIPPGSGADPELDEEGQPIEDSEKPPLPTLATGFEGLGFKSNGLPETVDDLVFPPADALPVPIEGVPQFSIPPPGAPKYQVRGSVVPVVPPPAEAQA